MVKQTLEHGNDLNWYIYCSLKVDFFPPKLDQKNDKNAGKKIKLL